jgi:PAS domain S-box-containing protein
MTNVTRTAEDVWILTDAAGFIVECSDAALRLLNYSARGARGRELPNLFVSDRPRLSELLQASATNETIERDATIRPNDRKAVPVHFHVRGVPGEDGRQRLLWTFTVEWPITMRLPRGVDRRQLITVWRSGSLRCVFVPAGGEKRRLFVCGENDAVVHEEVPESSKAAYQRATELQELIASGLFRR